MPIKKKKISELNVANDLKGFYTIGYRIANGVKESVKYGLEKIQNLYEGLIEAKEDAIQATTDVRQLEAIVEENEAERETSESQRNASEQARQTAETKRATSEIERIGSEEARELAETKRGTAEAERKDAELLRSTAEEGRVSGFNAMQNASEIATGAANASAASANQAAIGANESADNADGKAALANTAADNANDTANHPTYIGQDHYVYKWNKTTKAYDKTDVYTKGDAFSVKKVYTSVVALNADANNPDIEEGDFSLVSTGDVENPDNAKLYVKVANEIVDPSGEDFFHYEFLVDMSGAIGFTGKTPQFSMGNITTSEAGSTAQATVSEDGTDSAGNPKYKLNFSIPRGNPGAPFQVKGTYATVEALKVAVPDGSGVEGFIAVGTKIPYDYYAWVNGDWMDHGKIASDGGGKMVLIPVAVLNLTSTSTSNEVLNAFGSKEAFIDIVTKVKDGSPAAINANGLLMGVSISGGEVTEDLNKHSLFLVVIDAISNAANFQFSIALTGEVATVDKQPYAYGYADLTNTLTKFQLVSDPATGGTDKPASAEAVKVLNGTKADIPVDLGKFVLTDDPLNERWHLNTPDNGLFLLSIDLSSTITTVVLDLSIYSMIYGRKVLTYISHEEDFQAACIVKDDTGVSIFVTGNCIFKHTICARLI